MVKKRGTKVKKINYLIFTDLDGTLLDDDCKFLDAVATLKKLKQILDVNVIVSLGICPNCSRKTRGYYEATMQLRGNFNKVSEIEDYITTRVKQLAGKKFVPFTISNKNKSRFLPNK